MVNACRRLAESRAFQNVVLGLIVLGGILVGVETDRAIMARHGEMLHLMDRILVGLFTLELAIRITGFGARWPRFFADPWNVFDFVVVGVCLLPLHAEFAAVLRLFRVLRVLRLVTRLPKLQLLVGALLKCIPSMGYVALLLFLLFYVYAVVGVAMFGLGDPQHFGSLPVAMLTLFQVVTMEGWADIMRAQMPGHPWGGPVYFVSFIMIGTMIVLNLLIGVIMNSMTEMHEAMDREREKLAPVTDDLARAEAALAEAVKALGRLRRKTDGDESGTR